jgi:thiol-disulfide isomerase/thioredoxin
VILIRLFASIVGSVLLMTPFVGAAPAASGDDSFVVADYEGQVVLLDFWASWCVPCRHSFPWMQEMQHRYGDDGLVIVAVNLDNQRTDAQRFLGRYPVDFKVIFDARQKLARRYEVEAMPSSFLFGRDGKILERHMGYKVKRQYEYEQQILAALNEEG